MSDRRRHLLVKTTGLVMKAKARLADLADHGGARSLLYDVADYLQQPAAPLAASIAARGGLEGLYALLRHLHRCTVRFGVSSQGGCTV